MAEFIPGIDLSERYYREIIGPILHKKFPKVPCVAAHLGPGSDVLGFDTAMSTDHDWGPTVHILLHENDSTICHDVWKTLSEEIPDTFYG